MYSAISLPSIKRKFDNCRRRNSKFERVDWEAMPIVVIIVKIVIRVRIEEMMNALWACQYCSKYGVERERTHASIEPGLKLRPMNRPIAVTIRRNTYPTTNMSSERRERITRVLGGVATVLEDMIFGGACPW
jgi:hypothetical protein